MKKYEVLRAVVILQAVCMVVLSVTVVVKVWPWQQHADDGERTSIGGSDKPEEDHNLAATVGDQPITLGELEAELHKQYGGQVLRTMMVRKAIDLEAAEAKLTVSPEEQDRELAAMAEGYESETEFYDMMLKQLGMTKEQLLEDIRYRVLLEKIVVRSIDVTDDEVDQYIADHPEEYAPKEQLHLQWIVTETERQAEDVLEKLTRGEPFETLARTYSQDSFTAESGGDLGLIDADDPFYDSEMLDMAGRLQIAEMAGPIAVDGGFAIIRLVERRLTTGIAGSRLRDAVRKQLALEQAGPLSEQEDKLLDKYNSEKIK